MVTPFKGIATRVLVRILIIILFSLLFLSLWGCFFDEVPKNLISNGSFEEGSWDLSISQGANINLVSGYSQLFFFKKKYLNKKSKIRLFPTVVSPETPVRISGSIKIVNPIPKAIISFFDTINFPSRRFIPLPFYRTYILKEYLEFNPLHQAGSNNKNFDEISIEKIIPSKIYKILSIPIIKPLINLMSDRIILNLVSTHGDIKISSDEPNLLTSIDFKDEWRDYRNVAKQDWSYTKKFDYLPLHGNQSLMVDSWKTSHMTQKISGLEPGKEYLLLVGRRNILGHVSPSVKILEESGNILGESILPILLHEEWVRSLILFKPQQTTALIQLGGGSKKHSRGFRFVNLYDDVHLYKIPEKDANVFYRYLHSKFNILSNDISIGFKVVSYKKIIPKNFYKGYYKEHKTLGIPVLDLLYDSSAFWRKQLDSQSLTLKRDSHATVIPVKLKKLFPAQLKINKKNTISLGFNFRGVHGIHYVSRNKSIKISRKKKDRMYLLNPQTRGWLSEPFSYFVSRQLGGMGMRSDFVFLRMNGNPKGVKWRYWKDHTDLEFNKRPDGTLIEDSNSKYNFLRTEDDWKTIVYPENTMIRKKYPAKKVIVLFTTLLRKGLVEYIDGLANIKKFLTWHAHALIVDSAHQDSTHNSFFYLNSSDGRLEPIPIDINMGSYGTIDHEDNVKHFNPFIDKLLANFEFFNQRDQIIWKYISDTKSIRGALDYYDNLYKKNANAFSKTHPVSVVNEAPFSDEDMKSLLLRGKKVYLTRIGKLSRLLSENNEIRINITQHLLSGNSKSNVKQLFEVKVNPQKNSAWSSTFLESLAIKMQDTNGKIKMLPEKFGVRNRKKVVFPLKKFLPSDKYFIYQIYYLWEDEYSAILENLKNFPEKLKIIKKNYTKTDDRGYTLAFEVLKNKGLIDSITSIFKSIGKINVNKEMTFLVKYEGALPIEPLKDFSFIVKNGVTQHSITPQIIISKKNKIDSVNLKKLKEKSPSESIDNNLKLLSKELQGQSVYKEYGKIYSTIGELLTNNPAFVKGNSKNTILIKTGVYKFSENIILPKGIELIIEPGAELQFDAGVSLISYGKIRALGTRENPILFHGNSETTKWGVIGLLHEQSGGVFENCIFEGGGEAFVNGVYFSGMLAAHYADLEVRNSIFQKASIGGGDDAINVKYGKALILGSYFFNNRGDGIDLDFAKIGSEVSNSYFLKNGNDGIDISGSKVFLRNLLVSQSKEMGISLGEGTQAVINNIKVEGSKIALASKDSSQVKLSGGFFEDNLIGAAAYRKKTLYKGGMIYIINTIFEGNKFDLGTQMCEAKDKLTEGGCSSEIYIKNSKYNTHGRIIKTNIRVLSKQITSKKEITSSFKKNITKNGYKQVELSDTNIKKESPPLFLESIVKKISQENLLEKPRKIKRKIVHGQNTSFSPSTKELIDFSSSVLKKKNSWYLIKRELDLTPDIAWHYSKSLQNKVLQRRFNLSLKNIESIDITFHDDIPVENFKNLLCNFRISNSDNNYKILPMEGILVIQQDNKKDLSLGILGKKYVQYNIGDLVRYVYKDGETVFLKEIKILLPKSLTDISRISPLKSIRLKKRRSTQGFRETEFFGLQEEESARLLFGQQKKTTQIKKSPLDLESLDLKLPKWTSRLR